MNIEGDSDRLNQILLNLVANSINYTGEGGRIDISMEVTEYDVHIYISDTGIGIPEESVPGFSNVSTEWIKHVPETRAVPVSAWR